MEAVLKNLSNENLVVLNGKKVIALHNNTRNSRRIKRAVKEGKASEITLKSGKVNKENYKHQGKVQSIEKIDNKIALMLLTGEQQLN